MNEFHKENMRKHISFLEMNADAIRKFFDMKHLTHECGGPSCSLGFATLSVEERKCGEDFPDFSKRIFGINPCSGTYTEEKIGEYLFGARWVAINNTPEAAAARMKAVLYNQVPAYWNFYEEFAHPIVIVPEEVEQTLERV